MVPPTCGREDWGRSGSAFFWRLSFFSGASLVEEDFSDTVFFLSFVLVSLLFVEVTFCFCAFAFVFSFGVLVLVLVLVLFFGWCATVSSLTSFSTSFSFALFSTSFSLAPPSLAPPSLAPPFPLLSTWDGLWNRDTSPDLNGSVSLNDADNPIIQYTQYVNTQTTREKYRIRSLR